MSKPLRIAQVAPLWESVPPRGYGAIESLAADLVDRLVERGHAVTLFASAESKTAGNLAAASPSALNWAPEIAEPETYRMLQLADVQDRCEEFDVIHSHLHSNSGLLAVPLLSSATTPVIHTLHCYTNPDNIRILRRYSNARYIAISETQRFLASDIPFFGIIRHGLNADSFPYRARADDPPYLAFLGRIRPEKGVHVALEAAKAVGFPLKIAGRIKPQDQDYFDTRIRPYLDGDSAEYVGELDFEQKTSFLSRATACLVLPMIDEPFGLTTIEAGMCGTPVVALRRGALPEIVSPGISGIISASVQDLPDAIRASTLIDRQRCRSYVADRFSLDRMVSAYERAYDRALRGRARS